jgi:hypothetical protein
MNKIYSIIIIFLVVFFICFCMIIRNNTKTDNSGEEDCNIKKNISDDKKDLDNKYKKNLEINEIMEDGKADNKNLKYKKIKDSKKDKHNHKIPLSYVRFLDRFYNSNNLVVDRNNLDYFVISLIPKYMTKIELFMGSVQENNYKLSEEEKKDLEMMALVNFRDRLLDELIFILDYFKDLLKMKRVRTLVRNIERLLADYCDFMIESDSINKLWDTLYIIDKTFNNITMDNVIKTRCDAVVIMIYKLLMILEEDNLHKLLGFSIYLNTRDISNYVSMDTEEDERSIKITFNKMYSVFKDISKDAFGFFFGEVEKNTVGVEEENNMDVEEENNMDVEEENNMDVEEGLDALSIENLINNDQILYELRIGCQCTKGCYCGKVAFNYVMYRCKMTKSLILSFGFEPETKYGFCLIKLICLIRKFTNDVIYARNIFQYTSINYKVHRKKCVEELYKVIKLFESSSNISEEFTREVNKEGIFTYDRMLFNLVVDAVISISNLVPKISMEMKERIKHSH